MNLQSHAMTHIGRRSNNEDAFCHEPALGLFAVADGVGGYEGGEIASALTVEHLAKFVERNARDAEGTWPCRAVRHLSYGENLMVAAGEQAHREILARKTGAHSQMGSTLVSLHVVKNRAVVAHVGDSRAYRLRSGVLDALTIDHSLYAEMQAAGLATPRAQFGFRNVITRALGLEGNHRLDTSTIDVRPGDTLMLCSDGLHDPVSEETLKSCLAHSAAEACSRLIDAALAAKGSDNITVVVVHVQE